ncbi:hypothetical protein [Burkholderia cepacia]|uniref:hypothetical protein n=1 Tax=Burkholderia cepacia TaxID=292 RepID=UPI001CE45C78|nr:hypothetical protein [Burkholderia cepacia]
MTEHMSAFPVPEVSPQPGIKLVAKNQGMTLRDYFAAQAMAGDAANSAQDSTWQNDTPDDLLLERAKLYYRLADAMLKARG